MAQEAAQGAGPGDEETLIEELVERIEDLFRELAEDIPGEVNLRANLRKIQTLERTLGRPDTHPLVLNEPGLLDRL